MPGNAGKLKFLVQKELSKKLLNFQNEETLKFKNKERKTEISVSRLTSQNEKKLETGPWLVITGGGRAH